MSKKIKIPAIDRELRTEVNAPPRREPVRPAGLYLLELRRHTGNNSLPRRKLIVNVEGGERENALPKPVKITFA